MFSLSSMSPEELRGFRDNKTPSVVGGDVQLSAKQQAINQAATAFMTDIANMSMDPLQKSVTGKAGGVINYEYDAQVPGLKGLLEPDSKIIRWGYDSRGIREKYFNLSFDMLREIATRVVPIGAIQNLRSFQVLPFCQISYNDNDVGFMAKMKDKNGIASKQDKIIMREMEEFFLNCGKLEVPDADERDKFFGVMDMITRDMMTIDQVAISLRRNRKGKLIDFWVMDAATIKRILKGREDKFGKDAKFVQEIDGKILEVFTAKEMIFTYANYRSTVRKRGYGYSFLEMCIDNITAWLFAMGYNKEIFNSSSQPKGIISFEGDKLDQSSLEELQRQWVSMFRGIKGMWKTPLLQYGAKWIPIAPSNRDMEFNEYTQMLSSWICAIHGVDPAEFGIKLNQSQATLNDNPEAKIAYSKDRGLKHLLFFHRNWMNEIANRVPEWKDYYIDFTGMEAKSQVNILEVDEKQVKVYMTVNEKRKEKDLPPIEGGDTILDPSFMNMMMQKEANAGMGDMQGGEQGSDESQGESDGDYSNDGSHMWELGENDAELEEGTDENKKSDETEEQTFKSKQVWVPPSGSKKGYFREDPREKKQQETKQESGGLEQKDDGFFYYNKIKISKDKEKAQKFMESKQKGQPITTKEVPVEIGQKVRLKPHAEGRTSEAHKEARGIIAMVKEVGEGFVRIADEAGRIWRVNDQALEFAKSKQEQEYFEIII